MMERLAEAFETLSADPQCRVILLRGRGGHFCAGRALPQDGDMPGADQVKRRMDEAVRLAAAMLDCPKPIIAYVEGWAAGVGVSLALWSDIAVADTGARFVAPELKLGFPPTMTAVTLLRRANRAAAMEFLLTGRSFSAAEAMAAGMVSLTTSNPDAAATLDGLIDRLLQSPVGAVTDFKRLMRETDGLDLAQALTLAAKATLQWEGVSAVARTHSNAKSS
jgi:enoyl-CoA hydratase/carnithine racemase